MYFNNLFNALWPSDLIKSGGSWSTLVQVIPSHYSNQRRLFINIIPWHSMDSNWTGNARYIYHWNMFKICAFGITAVSHRGQWISIVKSDKSAGNLAATSSNTLSCMICFELRINFHLHTFNDLNDENNDVSNNVTVHYHNTHHKQCSIG